MSKPIDTMNQFGVCINGKNELFLMTAPHNNPTITPDEAMNLAAWLALVAEPVATHSFDEVMRAIKEA